MKWLRPTYSIAIMTIIGCLISIIALCSVSCQSTRSSFSIPYPLSPVLHGILLDWTSHKRLAEGSDNWPITWANNDHQYTSWGDGGGFGGTNTVNRVSIGVARVKGISENYTGENVWGGETEESTERVDGKSYGIISIGNILYLWVSPGSNKEGFKEARLYHSTNFGRTWKRNNWSFDKGDRLLNPTFLQFGRGYNKSRDKFVYIYAIIVKDSSELEVQKPGEITLMRVDKHKILNRKAYKFLSGFDRTGAPVWTSDILKLVPVFKDANGVGWNCAISFNMGLGRYLLTTEHHASFNGNIGIFDAPEPWGPWTTVTYMESFGVPEIESTTFFWNFSNKWLSRDGKNFVLLFTGIKDNDSWNTVEGEFLLPDAYNDKTNKRNESISH